MPTAKIKIILIVVVVVVVAAATFLGFLVFSTNGLSRPSGESGSTPKINIDEVCQSALAYMTFPDSLAAGAFVEECKEGKHPEVIEKWKQDNNITDDRAI